MKRACTEAENKIIKKCGKDLLTRPEFLGGNYRKRKKLPGKQFWIAGGTVLEYIPHTEDGPLLVFAEDDFYDADGRHCVMILSAPYLLNIEVGERILLVYNEDGAYMPLRITEVTRGMVSASAPDYIDKVNWKEATILPHPAGVELEERSRLLYEEEAKALVKKCNKLKNIQRRNRVGIFLFSVLILMFEALAFVFLVAGEVIANPNEALLYIAAAIVFCLILTVLFAKLVLSGKLRGLKKIQYKKKVLFCSTDVTFMNGYYERYISVFEVLNGRIQLISYPVINNYFLPKKTPYGKVLYKYSALAKSCARDWNFFLIEEQ